MSDGGAVEHGNPSLLTAIVIAVCATAVFLANLLIAQLDCAYQSTHLDMVGLARSNSLHRPHTN